MDKTINRRKTGILGGTFNPIHIGHLILAQNALEYCGLDEVFIMPSGVSYLKDPADIAPTHHRVNMVRLAIKGNDKLSLSTLETEREGNSYTFETLDILTKENPDVDYHYITGADTLFSMESWKRPDLIFDKCTVVCAKRGGYSCKKLSEKAAHLKELFGARIIIMDVPELEISSSFIRDALSHNKSCRYYLDDKVTDYIKVNGLYGFDRDK